MNKTIKIALLLTLFTQVLTASTQGSVMEYLGTRKAGMGGAAVAIARDRESMFYNPAMLYYAKNGFSFPLLNNAFILNDGLIPAINELSGDGDADNLENISGIIPLQLGFGYNTNTALVMDFPFKVIADKVAISGYTFMKFSGEITNPISPLIKIQGYADTVMPAISFSKSLNTDNDFFLEDVITGFTIKRINRISLYNDESNDQSLEIPVLSIIEGNDNYGYQDTSGYGFDLGITGQLPSTDINLALAINNLSTSLTGKRTVIVTDNTETFDVVQDIPTVAKVGVSFENDWLARFIPYIAYQIEDTAADEQEQIEELVISATGNTLEITEDIKIANDEEPEQELSTTDNSTPTTNQQKITYAKTVYALDFDIITPYSSLFKRVHLGLDQPVLPFLNIRLGLNQGYGTFGLKFNVFDKFHCGYTYFTEELGDEIGLNPASYHIYDFGFYW